MAHLSYTYKLCVPQRFMCDYFKMLKMKHKPDESNDAIFLEFWRLHLFSWVSFNNLFKFFPNQMAITIKHITDLTPVSTLCLEKCLVS